MKNKLFQKLSALTEKLKGMFSSGMSQAKSLKMPPDLGSNIRSVLDSSKLKERFSQLKKIRPQDLRNFRLPKMDEAKLQELLHRFERFIHHLFHVESRKRIHQYFVIVCFLVMSYHLGKISALILQKMQTPPPPAAPKIYFQPSSLREDLVKMERQNIFKAQTGIKAAKDGQDKLASLNIPCEESTTSTRMPIRLLDTIVIQDPNKSLASIQLKGGGDLLNVRRGDKIENIAIVGKIERLKIFLRNMDTGQCEFAMNQEGLNEGTRLSEILDPIRGRELLNSLKPKGIKNVGNNYTISRALLTEKTANPAQVLSEAKAVQIFNPDGSVSFKLVEVQPGSFFSYLGVQPEDLITQINGKKVTNLAEVFGLFQNIKSVDHLGLTINREGQDVELNYKVGE